ncbi:12446_t:CDS:2, partial [Cetraspora pellucida]
NEETKALFDFIMSGFNLPKCRMLGERVLTKASKNLQYEILKTAQDDENSVIAAFDKNLMTNASSKNIKIKAFVSDSTREYQVA